MNSLSVPASLAAFLEDTYLKKKISVNTEGTTFIDFKVTADAGSYAACRFMLVFKRSVRYTAINASMLNSDISVEWKIAEEFNISKYEIERSADGSVFSTVSIKLPEDSNSGSVNYSWLDAVSRVIIITALKVYPGMG